MIHGLLISWGLRILCLQGKDNMKILDIGCGNNKYPGSIGMDIAKLPCVDVLHNFDSFPYPFEDGSFNMIVMQHVLEHVGRENRHNIKIIEECHRILKDDGILEVEVPIGQFLLYDPTHVNYVGCWYWRYFSNDFPLNYYTHARFELIESHVVGLYGINVLSRFTKHLDTLYQKTPEGVERLINFLNLDMCVRYTLRKI